jgi:hypothetical protein
MQSFDRRGRGYVEHTPLTRFWPLYLPDRAEGEVPLDAEAIVTEEGPAVEELPAEDTAASESAELEAKEASDAQPAADDAATETPESTEPADKKD